MNAGSLALHLGDDLIWSTIKIGEHTETAGDLSHHINHDDPFFIVSVRRRRAGQGTLAYIVTPNTMGWIWIERSGHYSQYSTYAKVIEKAP